MQCIDIGADYSWKQRWILKGLKMLPPAQTSTTSHKILELLSNSVLLNVTSGRVDVALGTLEVALFGASELSHSSVIGNIICMF